MQADQAVRLKQGRLTAGYTIEEAAKQLNVAQSTYKDWERPGGSEPATISKMVEIADLYNISLDWWFRDRPCGPQLADAEQQLISNFNRLDPETQQAYLLILNRIQ